MRYKVEGFNIRSENAARSTSQPGRAVAEWLSGHPPVESALDLGCGKLRYGRQLIAIANRVTFVDSETQLSRTQRVFAQETSVRSYVSAAWATARVVALDDYWKSPARFDLVLFANVLSAIPDDLMRRKLVKSIRDHLASDGECLIATQYRNSYFRRAREGANVLPYLDGWIIPKGGGWASFYGVLGPRELAILTEGSGLRVVRSWTKGETACIVVSPARRRL